MNSRRAGRSAGYRGLRARPVTPPGANAAEDQVNTWSGDPLTRLSGFVNILGPTTFLTALLVYFGYVGTRARFEYFGVYLSMVNLSNQELLLSGLEVANVAVLVIFLGVLVATGAHAAVSWLLTSGARGYTWSAAGLITVAGVLLIGRALVGILVPGIVDIETPPGLTPLTLALGPVLVSYSLWIAVRLSAVGAPARARSSTFTRWYATSTARGVRRVATATVMGIFIVGMFWAANSFALTFGAGRAYQDALRLRQEPEVVVDTRERLQALPSGVTETNLDQPGGGNFRYRYRGLRLLIESDGRLFLIPQPWTRAGRTIIVPYDSTVRIQLIPAPTIYEQPSKSSAQLLTGSAQAVLSTWKASLAGVHR